MNTAKSIAYRWGQVLALLDAATPRGLTVVALNNAMTSPANNFASLMRKALPLPPDIDDLMGKIISEVQSWPENLTLTEQGDAHLGYYHMRPTLPEHKPTRGRPSKREEIDWSAVDWNKSDADISDELGCTRQAVRQMRAKRTPR
ncbi:hypothetical protein [Desulfovibrio sp. SGI.169]|uniref:hypothetical protein n=1 Tax=Desulfovibrio sp. SGI.169 TaxID=3420561 RepID=UPI003D022DA1